MNSQMKEMLSLCHRFGVMVRDVVGSLVVRLCELEFGEFEIRKWLWFPHNSTMYTTTSWFVGFYAKLLYEAVVFGLGYFMVSLVGCLLYVVFIVLTRGRAWSTFCFEWSLISLIS
jgi:hypothetical protein